MITWTNTSTPILCLNLFFHYSSSFVASKFLANVISKIKIWNINPNQRAKCSVCRQVNIKAERAGFFCFHWKSRTGATPGSSQRCMVEGQETAGIRWNERGSDRLQGETFSPRGQPGKSTGCPERLCSFHIWRFSSSKRTKPWAIWSDLTNDTAGSCWLDQRPPEVPPGLNYPTIHLKNIWI